MPFHVQVAGCARSGTTLMGALLRCFGGIEFAQKESEIIVERYLRRYGYPRRPGMVLGGKRAGCLGHYRRVGLQRGLKMIWMTRDGRDVLLSTHRGRPHYVSASRWIESNSQALEFRGEHPDGILFVRFEDLILDHQDTMLRIGEFIDLPLERSWPDVWDQIQPDGRFASEMRGVRDLDSSVIGQWRRLPSSLRNLIADRPAFSRMLVNLGYASDREWEGLVWK